MTRLLEEHENFGDKAPITEALIDLRCELGPGVKVADLISLREAIASTFPKVEMQNEWAHHVRISEGGESSVTQRGIRGFKFTDASGDLVLQARRDGFTLSRLRQYVSWDDLKSRAKGLWPLFAERAKPRSVTRCAVRYINRLALPPDFGKISDWLESYPAVSSRLGLTPSEFLVRFVLPHPSENCSAIVTQGTDVKQGGFVVVLDIDVFAACSLMPDTEDVWKKLDSLRDYKNDIFFGTLTERAKELLR